MIIMSDDIYGYSSSSNAQERWNQWILSFIREHPHLAQHTRRVPPKCGFDLISIGAAFVLPSLVPAVTGLAGHLTKQAATQALNYSIQELAKGNLGSQVSTSVLQSMLFLPTSLFSSMMSPNQQKIDRLIEQGRAYNSKSGGSKSSDDFKEILLDQFDNKGRAIILGLGAVSVFFFEWMGMEVMKGETHKNDILLTSQDQGVIGLCKGMVQKQYTHKTDYYIKKAGEVEGEGHFHLNEMDPVRTVYNVLVGVNYILFWASGHHSSDPTAEIVHWTSILFYWEILVRLVRLHGWSPVAGASKLLLADLWSQQQRTVAQPKSNKR